MKARSCDTSTNAPGYSERKLSSRSIAARSRWFHQKEIGLPDQHLRQLEPPPLAPRQGLDRAAEIGLAEADVRGQPFDARLQLVAPLSLIALLQLAVPGQLGGPAARQAPLQRDDLVVQALEIRERLHEGALQRAAPRQLL
jgi:hypothetical protein